jgi:hypothetical protein
MERECKIHGMTKHSKRSEGKGYMCNKCSSEAVSRRRKLVKIKAVNYKGGKCLVCGYNRCIRALHFHHLDPSQKDFAISSDGSTRSWEEIRKELDKCIMLCGNCHSEKHEQLFRDKDIELYNRLNNFNEMIKKPISYCRSCKKETYGSDVCGDCYVRPTKIQWPENNILLDMVKKSSFVQVGKKLGVSDNAVRKRLERANLLDSI